MSGDETRLYVNQLHALLVLLKRHVPLTTLRAILEDEIVAIDGELIHRDLDEHGWPRPDVTRSE